MYNPALVSAGTAEIIANWTWSNKTKMLKKILFIISTLYLFNKSRCYNQGVATRSMQHVMPMTIYRANGPPGAQNLS